ncbi:SAM-dependent methyltransferase [Salinispora sp. H7-4]|uniref:SAM-dependent methyltransferase n=1 Tax=Salinispora sp. H7-4 TaxID=2748321 RepID=UPI0015D0E082|nr:SAM-dependent methyltransferase [Salinispora sp. H7-4]NYT95594.1 SAM-dependent methyltransferase [Salinispora sp. H7-4]
MSQNQAEQRTAPRRTGAAPSTLDVSVPHSARVWNYWLGGKDNFASDRAAGDQVRAIFPEIVEAARYSRVFLREAVTYLAAEAGIRQFLDVGTGLPTADNTHQVAQRIAPQARVVYLDNDPMVLAHARVLLTSDPAGATQYLDADLHDSERVIREARATLDFSEPVGLMMLGVMGHVGDPAQARDAVRALVSFLPAGSFLAMSDGTATSERVIESHRQYNESGAAPYHLREVADFTAFFDGLDLVEPGVVPLGHWRPQNGSPKVVDGYCGVARKS